MSAIHEFTGVNGIPPIGTVGRPALARRLRADMEDKKKKKPVDVVDAFLAVAPANLCETAPLTSAPAAPIKALPVIAPPAAPVSAEDEELPVAPTTEALPAKTALMISKEVAEALLAGQTVSVRGVMLEPNFKAAARRPTLTPEVIEAQAQRLVGSIVESTGGPVDMNAAQPPPTVSDGKAVASAFRRFGG